MRLVTLFSSLLVLGLAAGRGPLAAQGPLSLEVRGGAALPTGSFARAFADAGPSVGVHFVYRRTARRGFRVGFDQHRFGCAPGACRAGDDLVATGWTVGTRVKLRGGPADPRPRLDPWVEVGLAFDRLEGELVTEAQGPPDDVSDLGLGGEVGVGAVVRVGGRFSASPGLRYRMSNTRFDDAGLVRMRFLALDLAVVLGF